MKSNCLCLRRRIKKTQTAPDETKCKKKVEREIETIRKDNEGLKKEIQEVRSALARLQNSTAAAPTNGEKFCAIEGQIQELAFAVSKLEVKHPPLPAGEDMDKLAKENGELKKNIIELTSAIRQLKDASSSLMVKEDVEGLAQKNTELENKVAELTSAINRLKTGSAASKGKSKSKSGMPWSSNVA